MCKELKELVVEYPFLKEVDSCSLRNSIFNLEDSYKNFFSKRSGYPVFKNKFSKQSYRTTCIKSSYKGNNYSNIEVDLKNKKIKLPKLGLVSIRGYRNLDSINGNIINATIERDTTNKYYVSVVVEETEFIREKVLDLTEEEIPHSVTCIVEELSEDNKMMTIGATIIVDRENLKKIIIGKNGSKIKEIGTRARKDIEAYFNKKVYLDLFVKVVPKWRDKEKFLNMIGYKDFLNK